MLSSTDTPGLEEFLSARNPNKQHSMSLESYLIKPIQRIMRYPLLIKQLIGCFEENTKEYHCLSSSYHESFFIFSVV